MRLIRLGALFGSLMLLVATSVSLINKRSELYGDQDFRLSSAVTIASNSVQNTLLRARAVTEIASADTAPAALLASFAEGSEACLTTDSGAICSGPDLAALDAFGAAAAESAARQGAAVVAVDMPSSSVLVVARADVTVVLQLQRDGIVGPIARSSIEEFGTNFSVAILDEGNNNDVIDIATADGRRVLVSQIESAFDDGSVLITASVPNEVGIGGNNPALYAALMTLGTVLLVLAAWTFLAERRQLERRATTDELTGLVNRREFERESTEAIEMAGRFGTGLCIMLIDLNGFKQINDTLGHQFGDVVLKECAKRLVDAVRDTDLVGRWGGDEFVVLLPGLEDASAVRNSAERIGASLSSTPVADDVAISGSVGAALYPRHGTVLEDLMQAADVAMYEAKSTGVVHRVAETIADPVGLPPPSYGGPERRRSIAAAVERERSAS